MDVGVPQIVRDLADGLSAAIETQNRYWLAVAVTSVFVLVPQAAETASGTLQLPFGFPAVNEVWFATLAVLVLASLITAFAAAQARAVRTTKLAHRILRERRDAGALIAGHDERDLFDLLHKTSLGHVASLPQVMLQPDRFFADGPEPSVRRRKLSDAVYFFFKLLSLLVWLALPAAALSFAVYRFFVVDASESLGWLAVPVVLLFAVTAGVALLIAFSAEVAYSSQVIASRVVAASHPPNPEMEQTASR